MLCITRREISPWGRALKLGEGQWRIPLTHPVELSTRMAAPEAASHCRRLADSGQAQPWLPSFRFLLIMTAVLAPSRDRFRRSPVVLTLLLIPLRVMLFSLAAF